MILNSCGSMTGLREVFFLYLPFRPCIDFVFVRPFRPVRLCLSDRISEYITFWFIRLNFLTSMRDRT